jgi:hypothetical protein
MIKLFALRQTKWVLLLAIICIGLTCGKNQLNKTLFYEDFNFRCYCGVKKISPNDTEKLKTKEHRLYELFYKGDHLDSMVVFHPWNKSAPIILKCNHKDSLTVFEAVYSALGSINGKKTYFYFNNHTFIVYQYLGVDGWLTHNVTGKRFSTGLDIILKPGTEPSEIGENNIDTVGFINKLFQHEKFTIVHTPALRDTTLKIRVTKNFTFNTWFDSDGL